jgi:hypothetical protein
MPQAVAQRKAWSVAAPKGLAAAARVSAIDMRRMAYSFLGETVCFMAPR